MGCLGGFEAEVAGGEVELFVVERVVGDVHLAVDAAERTIGVEDGGGVVVDAQSALFEERCNQDDAVLPGGGGEFLSGRAGDGLGQVEQGVVFALAEVLGLEKLGQADDLRAFGGRVGHAG